MSREVFFNKIKSSCNQFEGQNKSDFTLLHYNNILLEEDVWIEGWLKEPIFV